MKSIILIISIIIYITCSAQCQISGIYSLEKFSNNIECNIRFFKSGFYYIDLSENVTSDIKESLVLSYGKFTLKNNELTLIDKVHNYKIVLVLDNKKINVIKAHHFLKNTSFIFNNIITTSEPKFLTSYIDSLVLKEERKIYNKYHKTLAPLNLGVFENEKGFKLSIEQNKEFKLEFKNIVLSRGKWHREGNELILRDVDLNHSFYMLIERKVLISKLLPGDYKSCVLMQK